MKNELIDAELSHAVVHFEMGLFEDSNEILRRIVDNFGPDAYRYFCIGRNYLYVGELEKAKAWLTKSIDIARDLEIPVFPWTFYELAMVEKELDNASSAVENLIIFLESGDGDAKSKGFNKTHIRTMLDIAHTAYRKTPDLVVKIYKLLHELQASDYLAELRIIESLATPDSVAAAYESMLELRGKYKLDAWGFMALSRVHQLQGEKERARDALLQAMEGLPTNLFLRTQACIRLISMDMPDDARPLLDKLIEESNSPSFKPDQKPQIHGLELRFACHQHDAAQVARLLADPAYNWRAVPRVRLVEAMFEFATTSTPNDSEDMLVAEQICGELLAGFSSTAPEVNALLHYFGLRRQWSEAKLLLAKIEKNAVYRHPDILIRRFDYCCATYQMEVAAEIYTKHFEGRELSNWASASTLRFLAEQKRWSEAGAVLARSLAKGHEFPGAEHMLLQVARRADARQACLAAMNISAGETGAGLKDPSTAFRQMLIDDLCVEAGLSDIPDIFGAAGECKLSPRSTALVSPGPSITPASECQVALYLCTDTNYFFSVVTFLASYFMHNQHYSEDVRIYVFLGEDVPLEWDTILEEIGSKVRYDIEVVRESEFIMSSVCHNESYGLFTGGNSLSRAAYFRIYAAIYLNSLGKFNRLCYVDSDIICLSDLYGLFHYEMGGYPLAARREELTVEVIDAARQNEIEPSSYFNSGVLVFDLRQQDTAELLERAVHLSENEMSRLFYHDQCALNIAFAGRSAALAPVLNHFLRPHKENNGDLTESVLVHYVDRPKPWDVSYVREYREMWVRAAELVKLLLSPRQYHEMVNAANGRRLT